MITKQLFMALSLLGTVAAGKNEKSKNGQPLAERVKGDWTLVSVTCNGAPVAIDGIAYTLSFNGATGAYVSKKGTCTQTEPETYTYVNDHQIAIKQGIRQCSPNPCDADLAASECGKETNPKLPVFDVTIAADQKTLTLRTDDPNAIDCTGPGQKKPAVFVLKK